jgi:hypothetical protein
MHTKFRSAIPFLAVATILWSLQATHAGPKTHYSEEVRSPGQASSSTASGNPVGSVYVLRARSISTFPVEMLLDGTSNRMRIARGATVMFEISIVARSSIGPSAGYMCRGIIKNVAGRTAFVSPPIISTIAADEGSWRVGITTDLDSALKITVVGAENREIRWVATVRTLETTF